MTIPKAFRRSLGIGPGTKLDSSVLLDVLLDDPRHRAASLEAFRSARAEGPLVACPVGASGGKRTRLIPDFLVGAHALIRSARLLSRDRGFYRAYFKGLAVLEPA